MRDLLRTGLVGLLLAVVVLGSASPEPWSARHAASYESRPTAGLLPADSEPLWSVMLTVEHVSALDGTVYAFVADTLTALDVSSGDVIWRRTHSPTGPLLVRSDGLFAAAGDTLLNLDSRSGVIVWQRQLRHGEITSLHRRFDRMLVRGSMWRGGDLLDAESGEVLYGFGITDNAWPVCLDDSILYIREYSGEPHFYHAVLHDLGAGEKRWWLGFSDGPIFRSDGHAYFVRQHLHRRGPQDLRVVDEQSGQAVATWQYSSGEGNVRLSDFAPHWIMTGSTWRPCLARRIWCSVSRWAVPASRPGPWNSGDPAGPGRLTA